MKKKRTILLTILIILGIIVFHNSSFSQELTPYLKVLGEPSFNLKIAEYELKEIQYNISNILERLENKDVLYGFYSVSLAFNANQSSLKELEEIIRVYRPENVSEKGALESMSSLLDEIHTKEMQFRKKSIPIFLKWFQNQLNDLDSLDIKEPRNLSASLILLSQMDEILSKRIKGAETLAQADLQEDDTTQEQVPEKEKPSRKEPPPEKGGKVQPTEPQPPGAARAVVYVIDLNEYKNKLRESEKVLRQRGQKILGTVEKEANGAWQQKIGPLAKRNYKGELEVDSEKLEFAFGDIFQYGKLIFDISNKSNKSEVLGGRSQWNILGLLPVIERILGKQEMNYSDVIEKISQGETGLNSWQQKIEEEKGKRSEIQGEIEVIEATLNKGPSCIDLITAGKKIQELIDNKEINSQPEKLERLGEIIRLHYHQRLMKMWQKHPGVSARLILIEKLRTIDKRLYEVRKIIKKKNAAIEKTKTLSDEISELKDAIDCKHLEKKT